MRKLLWLLLLTSAFAQTTSTITGVVRDLSQVVVATGKVTFTLVPGGDATISGFARFSNQIVTCTINQAAVATSQAVRAANSVTISSLSSHTFIVNDVITVSGMTDSTFNGTFTITSKTASSITYSQTAGNATSGGGIVSALRGGAPAGTTAGSCLLTLNTALNPPGSSYLAKIYPANVLTSQFTFAAYNTAIDITTIVPTPSQLPTYFVVDTVNNQSIAGNKTFTGSTVFSGTITANAAVTATAAVTSNIFSSASANAAGNGVLRFATADQFCFRNFANGADICISKTGAATSSVPADSLDFSVFGGLRAGPLIDTTSNPAQSGYVRMISADCIGWRNAGNTGDVTLCKDGSDRLTYNALLVATPTVTLKKGTGAGDYTSASTTYVRVDSTNLAFTVTVPTGWKLLVQAGGSAATLTAAVGFTIALADGSADNTGILVEQKCIAPSVNAVGFNLPPWVINGDGASHTINLQYKTSNGADSVTISNSTASLLPTMTLTLVQSN